MKGGGKDMLIIPIKEGENIDRALKRYKENLTEQVLCVSYVAVSNLQNLLLKKKSTSESSIHSAFERSRRNLNRLDFKKNRRFPELQGIFFCLKRLDYIY